MRNLKTYNELNEAAKAVTLEEIKKDFDGFHTGGGGLDHAEIGRDDKTVSRRGKHVGNWVHDEEAHSEEGAEDDDWKEDDDQMIWAYGEHEKYMKKFTEWAKDKPWFKKVKLGIETSEKNGVDFIIQIIK